MSDDTKNSILEERTTSVTLGSNIEDIINAENVTIAPPTSNVPLQHSNISGHHNTVVT